MITRRELLGRGTLAAGTAMMAAGAPPNVLLAQVGFRPTPRESWTSDQGEVRVSLGPWNFLPETPSTVRSENLYLRMPDGTRLNAFLYLPIDASVSKQVPAILNTTPYRNMPRSDSTAARNGYASIFVDVRGTGGSEGIPLDEYSHQEHEDTEFVIDWLSKQSWCNGNVGMYGASYSAINSLQIAYELKPAALKAIFLECGTDIRYTDDIHYPGGSMLMVDNSWALGMLVMNAMPGAPNYVLDDRAALDRWDQPPWLLEFLKNQVDGPYWQHGSLAPDYGRLEIPTFLAGGYLDIYQNQVMRIMRNSTNADTRGILGPWHHSLSKPGPAIDLEAIRLRWFDHWLKGEDTGMLDEPRAAFYMPSWRRQSFRFVDDVPGEWRYLDQWPETAFDPMEVMYFRPEPELSLQDSLDTEPAHGAGGRLTQEPGAASAQKLQYRPGTGGTDQSFGPTDREGFYGMDRRGDDAYCLCFDTERLDAPVEILGFAKAKLFVASTAPVANWIVRICDVAADGTSYLVCRGYLNGTHRSSHSNPEALIPGQRYELDIDLMCTAYRFEPGHRIRISVSNADFPVLWPSPENMSTTLFTGGEHASCIRLPLLAASDYKNGSLPTAKPRTENYPDSSVDGEPWYQLVRDLENGVTTAKLNLPLGGILECRVVDSEPGNASMDIHTSNIEDTDGRSIEVTSEGQLRSTPTQFIVNINVDLRENGVLVRSRRWQDEIERRLV